MPNKASATKRLRKTKRQNLRNRMDKHRIHSLGKRVLSAIEANDMEKAKSAFVAYQKEIDKAQMKGLIKQNTVARRKARIHTKLNEALS